MLKQLKLRKQIALKNQERDLINSEMEKLNQRTADAEAAIDEAETEEDMGAVETEIEAIEGEKSTLTERLAAVEAEITSLTEELEKEPETAPAPEQSERSKTKNTNFDGGIIMRSKFFRNMERSAVEALVQREDVQDFITRTRELMKEKRAVTGAELSIPTSILSLLRDNIHRYSKMLKHVRIVRVGGVARQLIAGTIPEAVWTEMCASLNELKMAFNAVETDGYKVGGYIPVCNALLEDSDINLVDEIMDMLAQSIGFALDKAIFYGKGVKMPLGIATRLAQESAPSDWSPNAPAWTDLHESNILALDIMADSLTPVKFFSALFLAIGTARPNYATGGTFWAMNRKTRMNLMAKSLAFNAAGAIVAGGMGTMPVEGGAIEEFDFIPDNNIIGGYGSLYLLAERAGTKLATSEHFLFTDDKTVFKGTARYDGLPVFGESFMAISLDGTAPVTEMTFAADTAN